MYTSSGSGLNVESEKLIGTKDKLSNHKRWSNLQLLFFIFMTVIVSCLLSNIDRIIELFESNDNNEMNNYGKYDILIVGGGVSGLAAMNLLHNDSNTNSYDVLLIEKLSRLGGRSFSPYLHYKDKSINFETGALRLNYNPLQWKILYHLNLCNQLLPFRGYQNQTYIPNTFRRNTLQKTSEFDDIVYSKIFNFNQIDYKILFNETYGNVLDKVWNDVIYENNNADFNLTDDDWINFWYNWTLKGGLVRKWSLNAMYRYYLNDTSMEYYNFIDVRYFNPDGSMADRLRARFDNRVIWNISEQYKNYPQSTLKFGLGSVPYGLYNSMNEKWKNNVLLSTELKGIEYSDNNEYKYKIKTIKTDTNAIDYVYANNVILSVPFMDLRNILPSLIPINNDETVKLFDCGNYIDYNKINIIYDTNINSSFWNNNLDLFFSLSGSETDEEITQIYMEKSWMNDTLFVVHIYGMGEKANLFHKLQIMGDIYPINEEIKTEESDGLIACSTFVVDVVMKQIETLTNFTNIPYPLACFINPMSVNTSNVAGLIEDWKYETNVHQLIANIDQPNKDENIYIAVSETGGSFGLAHWQWGGINAAIKVLGKYFNVNNPFHQQYPQCPPYQY